MTAIQIDLAGVGEIIAKLRSEVEDGLTPTVREGLRALSGPLPFGERSPSAEVKCARQANTDAVDGQVSNLSTHLSNAHSLVTGLQMVVDGYRQADFRLSAGFAALDRSSSPDEPAAQEPPLVAGFVGPIAPPALPAQPDYPPGYCLDWSAYNVPRLAAILQPEGTDRAFDKAMAYRRCGDGLEGHQRRMITLREELALVWVPDSAPAAVAYFERLSAHISAVAQDAMCAKTTATGLHAVVDTLRQARQRLAGYKGEWDSVSGDFVPEFWDHAAEELNAKARREMIACDQAIADWRKSIIVPRSVAAHTLPARETPNPGGAEGGSGAGSPGGAYTPPPAGQYSAPPAAGHHPVPPVPGMDPVVGPTLSTAPAPIPATPANPPSMLPVPPGVHGGAPGGGAWVLPGPGVGAQGRLLLPGQDGAGRAAVTAPVTGRQPAGAPATGVIGQAGRPGRRAVSPVTGGVIGGQGAARQRRPEGGEGEARPGVRDQLWQVRHGVAPVIDQPGEVEERHVTALIGAGVDAGFAAWYLATAEPWATAEGGAQ